VQRIQRDNEAAAAKVANILYQGCDDLRNFPRRGRSGRIEGTRELVFPGLPYILVYQIKDQIVEVIRIYHGAQDWP
jgi:toxin ParE1/3/4